MADWPPSNIAPESPGVVLIVKGSYSLSATDADASAAPVMISPRITTNSMILLDQYLMHDGHQAAGADTLTVECPSCGASAEIIGRKLHGACRAIADDDARAMRLT